jgi:hypothetical protein
MDIFVHPKVVSSSEFKCDSNELIFSLIRPYELGELRKFYKMFPEMEGFHAMPLVLQTAVTSTKLTWSRMRGQSPESWDSEIFVQCR